ncbi:MAG: GNAT family N-acetyltransferase [Herpetosiphonaceae bacterium]|nr:GNAT family N-acetyltransferase [Herpetosiphonaceae bacterium]
MSDTQVTQQTNDITVPQAVGDGLVLRWSTAEDVERIGELAAYVFRQKAEEPPNAHMVAWMRDLGSGRHPLTTVDQGVLVEDTHTGKVVASMWLIPITWSFGGIRFGVGRPEAVATHPEYRRRGLIRALFDAFHARSARAGDLAQAITGIPYFYRQFGYEMALELGGGRFVQFDDIPPLKDGETEAYRLQPATEDDLPFVMELYQREQGRSLVSSDIPEAYWHWTLDGMSVESGEGWTTLLINDLQGAHCGFVLVRHTRWGKTLDVIQMAVTAGTTWSTPMPSVLRALQALAPQVPTGRDRANPSRLLFSFGTAHPAYLVLGDALAPRRDRVYAWYVRIPDLPGFVQHVAPVLEGRLSASPLAGYSGDVHLDFYRDGLHLHFADGRLTTSESWRRPIYSSDLKGAAGFPPLVFLQLLFGRHSRTELEHIFPDVWASDEAGMVLDVLFPPQSSLVLTLD